MAEKVIIIERGPLPVPKIRGRGRRKGSGSNMQLLRKMKEGDSVWDLTENKMESIRSSAFKGGFKIKIRKIPDSELYVIFKL